MEVLENSGKTHNLSPRKTFCGAKAGSTYPTMRREMEMEELGIDGDIEKMN